MPALHVTHPGPLNLARAQLRAINHRTVHALVVPDRAFLEALVDPKAYTAKRETAFTEMIGHVRKSYDDAYKGFLTAGMSTDMAKQFSLQAANNERITRRQVIEVRFPTNANMIGDMSTIRSTAGSVMNLEGGQGRAAPARRRAAPRKKRAPARRRR